MTIEISFLTFSKGVKPIAEIGDTVAVGVDPNLMYALYPFKISFLIGPARGIGPVPSIRKLLAKMGTPSVSPLDRNLFSFRQDPGRD